MRIIGILVALAANAFAEPPSPAALCARFEPALARCPAFADVHMTHDECLAVLDPQLGRCVTDHADDCKQLASCIYDVAPDGFYAYSALAVDPACRSSAGPSPSPLVGKPMPALAGKTFGGDAVDLASLKRRPILVVFTASWESSASHDLARLAKFAGAELVVVVSGDEPAVKLPASAHVIHDVGPKDLGAITGAWGITAVPESFLIDRAGVVRFHYVRAHDWTSAGAARCLKTLAR